MIKKVENMIVKKLAYIWKGEVIDKSKANEEEKDCEKEKQYKRTQ